MVLTSGLHTHTQTLTCMRVQINKRTCWHGSVISAPLEADMGELQVHGYLAYRVNSKLVVATTQ